MDHADADTSTAVDVDTHAADTTVDTSTTVDVDAAIPDDNAGIDNT